MARLDISELRKTYSGVFDNATIMSLWALLGRGAISAIGGQIKSGKESTILVGSDRTGEIAIKVYAVTASNFRRMAPYLHGDPRFKRVKRDRRSVIYAWCQKEFANLSKAAAASVAAPQPRAFLNNILVMEFLGEAGLPWPRLVEAQIHNPLALLNEIVENIRKLYAAGLVHSDLSEFNILLGDRAYLIDFSHATVLANPAADGWLRRDISNICKFFKKLGIAADEQQIYARVTKGF